jgi:hypothetical protein
MQLPMSSFARYRVPDRVPRLDRACGGGSDGTSPNAGIARRFQHDGKVDGAAFVASTPSLTSANQVAPGSYYLRASVSSTTAAERSSP